MRGHGRPPLLVTRDLTVTFRRGGSVLTAVSGLSYELESGRTLSIVGESGSGKTTACRALLGLLPSGAAVAGSVRFEERELLGLPEEELRRVRGAGLAMVFQDPSRALNPTMRVGAQITEALRRHRRLDAAAARREALELLTLMELPAPAERLRAFPHQLSGGMRQRVMIAIAIACRPKVLIADEITASLDVITHRQILKLLLELQRELGMALVVVTHDLRLAAGVADDVLVMQRGRAVEHGRTAQVLHEPRMPYTRALVDAAAPSCGAGPGTSPTRHTTSPREVVLDVRNLRQTYALPRAALRLASRHVDAVADVSFTIGRGETLGLVGESGAGKTTIARALLQAPPPRSGSVRLLGTELTTLGGRRLTAHRRRMQMIFQDPFGSLNPKWRVAEIVEEPLLAQGIRDRRERRRRVAEVMDRVGLPFDTYGRRLPRELSGGQGQRVAIARALAPDPALIICDEAVSSLDVLVRAQVLDLFDELRSQLHLSYLFISHDLAVVGRISDRVAVLYRGRLCEIAPRDSLYQHPRHPYTAALLEASGPTARDAALPGRSSGRERQPTRGETGGGCRFLASCSRAQELCARQVPLLRPMESEHLVACHFPLENARPTSDRPEPLAAAAAAGGTP